jgi:hypothetical protein
MKEVKAEELLLSLKLCHSEEQQAEKVKHYARIQIEKDRERVKANVCCNEVYTKPKSQNAEPEYLYSEVDMESIDQTPITLD